MSRATQVAVAAHAGAGVPWRSPALRAAASRVPAAHPATSTMPEGSTLVIGGLLSAIPHKAGRSAWSNDDAYGKRSVFNASGIALPKTGIGFWRGFTGYQADEETGLYYARNRMYSSALGRFIGRDSKRDGDRPFSMEDQTRLRGAWSLLFHIDALARGSQAALSNDGLLAAGHMNDVRGSLVRYILSIYENSIVNRGVIPSAGDGYQSGLNLYAAYYAPNGLDPMGSDDVTITYNDGTVWNSGVDPDLDKVRKKLEESADGSIANIRFNGHGAPQAMQINNETSEGLYYNSENGSIVWTDTQKDAIEIFRKKLKQGGLIDFDGCHTARDGSPIRKLFADPATNISYWMSMQLPGVYVKGTKGFAVGTGHWGNLFGSKTHTLIRDPRTYLNGVSQ